eukprot:10464297-Karenia_brevis.AAC.1
MDGSTAVLHLKRRKNRCQGSDMSSAHIRAVAEQIPFRGKAVCRHQARYGPQDTSNNVGELRSRESARIPHT